MMKIKIVFYIKIRWKKTAPLSKCYVANRKINEIVTRYYHKNIVTIARKSVTETSIARSYVTRRECKIRNRVAKTLNRRRVSTPRPATFDVPIQRVRFASPVTDHKSSRYRRVALLSGTLLNAATLNVRLGGIPEPVRYPSKDAADDQCGLIVASGLP